MVLSLRRVLLDYRLANHNGNALLDWLFYSIA